MGEELRQGCASLPGETAHREVAMLGEEQWEEVHRLFTVERWSKSAIARELDLGDVVVGIRVGRLALEDLALEVHRGVVRPGRVLAHALSEERISRVLRGACGDRDLGSRLQPEGPS